MKKIVYNNNTFSKNVFRKALILLLAITICGCSKEDNTPKADPIPTLSGIDPDNGPKNTTVTINGNNFGTDSGKVQVFFNDVEAAVQTVSNTQITVTVPPRAYSGFVKVIINGTELTGPEFMYLISDVQVSTLAGSTQGFADGAGAAAQFDDPRAIALDVQENLYVVDEHNQKIRKITPKGEVSTLAGSTLGFADGAGAAAQFYDPIGVAVDAQGNIYVGDSNNNKIRKITPDGDVSTLAGSTPGYADGTGTAAQFNAPYGVAVDAQGNVYVADVYNHKIRKVSPNGEVSTLAGSTQGLTNGLGTAAQFNFPRGITVDSRGNVYVSDSNNHQIRKITSGGVVTTLAGSVEGFKDGAGETAQFDFPTGIAVDAEGTKVYVADENNHKIRRIEPNGEVSTIAGGTLGFADGTSETAQFNSPYGVAIDVEGNLYISDNNNNKIRKMIPE